jgi:N-acetylneuraminic acid mutarotase
MEDKLKKQALFLSMVIIFSFGIKITFAQGGCWTTKTSMDVPRGLMPAVLLNDTIYVIGGSLDATTSTSFVEAYDVSTDIWTYKTDLPQKLCGTIACAVNSKIYVIGGSTSILGKGYVVDSVYEYNPVSNSWTRKSNIPTPLMAAAAAVVDGKIYVVGGAPFGMNSAYTSVYEYNPATDTWTKKSDMPTARLLASATVVDGKIYVFGGAVNLYGTGFSKVEVYDPSADTWAVKGPMPIPRATHVSSAVNGNIYIFTGALRPGSVYKDVLEYNPTLDTWATKTSIPTPRVAPAACSVGGKIYVLGGMDNSNTRLTTVEEYTPALDTTNIVSVVDKNSGTQTKFILEQNYPNPFNPTTKIKYSIPSVGTSLMKFVQLKIYDILGNEVATLVNEEKPAGTYEVEFNGNNLSSGVYFYQIKAGSFISTKKFLLLK